MRSPVAIVTNADAGIGKDIAIMLSANGWLVECWGSKPGPDVPNVDSHTVDLSWPSEIADAVTERLTDIHVDALIHCPHQSPVGLKQIEGHRWEGAMDSGPNAFRMMIQALLPQMRSGPNIDGGAAVYVVPQSDHTLDRITYGTARAICEVVPAELDSLSISATFVTYEPGAGKPVTELVAYLVSQKDRGWAHNGQSIHIGGL